MTALNHVINGTVHSSKIVLFEDTVHNRSSHLLECIIQKLGSDNENRFVIISLYVLLSQ